MSNIDLNYTKKIKLNTRKWNTHIARISPDVVQPKTSSLEKFLEYVHNITYMFFLQTSFKDSIVYYYYYLKQVFFNGYTRSKMNQL